MEEIECPYCGGTKAEKIDTKMYQCIYCRETFSEHESVVPKRPLQQSTEPNIPLSDNPNQNVPQNSTNEASFPEITFAANNSTGQGGKLHITSDSVFFKPHAFNFGNKEGESFKIEDVCFYSQEGAFSICTVDGHEWSYAVWKEDAIIKAIEARRAYIFQSKGMALPPLTKERMAKLEESEPTVFQQIWKAVLPILFIIWLILKCTR